MTQTEVLRRAREVKAQRVAAYRYSISWRGGGSEPAVSVERVLALIGCKLKSLRCFLSTGKGTHSWQRTNPLTGEPDIVTVTLLKPVAKPKPRRGRPPKIIDWERLGSEAKPKS